MNRNQFYSWFPSLREIATANLPSISFSQIKKSGDIELGMRKPPLLPLAVFRAPPTEGWEGCGFISEECWRKKPPSPSISVT